MLLRPLPVDHPEQLINLSLARAPSPGCSRCNQAGDCDVVFSYPMFRDLEKSQTVLSGLAAHRGFGVNLSFKGEPITGDGMFVSGSYFPTLGLTPAVGRLLGPSDDQAIGASFVTVLSYSYWQAHFGGDRGVIGQTLTVNGQIPGNRGCSTQGFRGAPRWALGRWSSCRITMRSVVWSGTRQLRQSPAPIGPTSSGGSSPGSRWTRPRVGPERDLPSTIITDVEAPLREQMSDATMVKFKARELGVAPGPDGSELDP